jgi:hypothetical protein
MKLINFFLVKSLECKKARILTKFLFKTAFYGLYKELEPAKVVTGKSWNRNRTVTFQKLEPKPESEP